MIIVNNDEQYQETTRVFRLTCSGVRRSTNRAFAAHKRHDQNACPLCGERIPKTAAGQEKAFMF